jgi:primosomal protein N' (replication factor Y) (superfamily II helicase)
LPLSLPGLFTYEIPEKLNDAVRPGVRVRVQVGKRKTYTALVHHVGFEKPAGYEVRPILDLLDDFPVVNGYQLQLWDWLAEYYMCSTGEIYRAAMPSGLKVDSKAYVPRTISYVGLTRLWQDEDALNRLLDSLNKAPSQQKLVMAYLEVSGYTETGRFDRIEKAKLMKGRTAGAAAFNGLSKKGIFETEICEVSRLEEYSPETKEPAQLNESQEKALHEIGHHFETRDVVLLHGITSSGKTEVYIHLIREMLRLGRQVLYLLPEIALTTQIITRLRGVFGNKVGVYHSKFPDNKRVEIWNKVSKKTAGSDPYQVVLGARSALFLPFDNLGLVIVDEEHENTFKQFDPAPRYHARDAAIMLAHFHKAKVLLGSATPSLESFYNCLTGKYGYAELTNRYLDLQPPEIKIVNIREAYRRKQMKSHFSVSLLGAIENALSQKEQVILFQNRRGFSLYLECAECHWVPHCRHCDVSLTYHKKERMLSCHYCGYSVPVYTACSDCGSPNLQMKGFGTEKIEDEMALFFPEARIARMDLDVMRSVKTYERTITRFENGETDVLVGTQMVSKGLDFDNVGLVGILNADNMLNYPDFRAFERGFQLMLQVSGRAGRKNKRGTVIIQTYDDSLELYHQLKDNDFRSFALGQLADRKNFHYPPFSRLIEIMVKGKNKEILDRAALALAELLKKNSDIRVMGPEYPLISRIQNHYLKQIILKIDKARSVKAVKECLETSLVNIHAQTDFKSIGFTIDVDPV